MGSSDLFDDLQMPQNSIHWILSRQIAGWLDWLVDRSWTKAKNVFLSQNPFLFVTVLSVADYWVKNK